MANNGLNENKFWGPVMDGAVNAQPLYAESTTKRHELGFRWQLPDGRVFRYAKNGTVALSAGKVCQNAANVLGSVPNTNFLAQACKEAAAIGATTVKAAVGTTARSTTTVFLNAFQDGHLIVATSGGSYRIKSSGLYSTTITGTTLTLFEPLRAALTTTSSKLTLLKNVYDGVVVAPATTATGIPVGVPPIAVTASTAAIPVYFWIQTWGPAAVYGGPVPPAASMPAIGHNVVTNISTTMAGGATTGGDGAYGALISSTTVATALLGGKKPIIGLAMVTPTTTANAAQYHPVFLRIAP